MNISEELREQILSLKSSLDKGIWCEIRVWDTEFYKRVFLEVTGQHLDLKPNEQHPNLYIAKLN